MHDYPVVLSPFRVVKEKGEGRQSHNFHPSPFSCLSLIVIAVADIR